MKSSFVLLFRLINGSRFIIQRWPVNIVPVVVPSVEWLLLHVRLIERRRRYKRRLRCDQIGDQGRCDASVLWHLIFGLYARCKMRKSLFVGQRGLWGRWRRSQIVVNAICGYLYQNKKEKLEGYQKDKRIKIWKSRVLGPSLLLRKLMINEEFC